MTELESLSNAISVVSRSTFMGREIDIYGTIEDPMFLARDVARWIEHSDVSTMIRTVDESEKGANIVCTPGGNQTAWFLTEDGLYEVLMQSRKPIAKQFKKGIKEILKKIRKTGSYIPTFVSTNPIKEKIEAGMAWIEGCKRILNLNESSTLSLIQKVGEPLGLPSPDYVSCKGVMHSASELLKTNNINISAIKLNAKFVEAGLLREETRQGKTKTHKFKVITEKGREYGENQVSPKNPQETQPLWYDDKFQELLSIAGIQNKIPQC